MRPPHARDGERRGNTISVTPQLSSASHLSQSASDTADPKPEIYFNGENLVAAYWKSKEGKCLACGLSIAVQDQYCPKCEEFLLEVHAQREIT